MSTPLWKYLSIKKDVHGLLNVDKQRLQNIRKTFDEIYGDRDREDDDLKEEYIKKLINQLDLIEDKFCLDCLDKCVSESSDDCAEMEVKAKINTNVEILNMIPTDEIQSILITSNPAPTNSSQQHVTSLDKIICVVHRKSTKPEVNDFLKKFLFRQVNQISKNPNEPICNGGTHPLVRNCILDLFIRRQMIDRGTITSPESRTKHRLVEPISLTDEFESWTFDHFRGLFDFWLVRDVNNQATFPNLWELNSNASIDYIISNGLINNIDDPSMKHIERPSTKSLDSFIRDICKIEDNGMFLTWYKALSTEENITTYAHLTNLNQKEWDRVGRLPMNALKTLKFYIDQEKQSIEQRKVKQNQEENLEDKSYSKAEIRANLHMIKLYFNRQLEDVEGIKPIPRLDSYCVEEAFNEMRREGYEDDGLFDQMKLFFQPLTVTDNELIIDQNDLSNLNSDEVKEKERLEKDIQTFKRHYKKINQDMVALTKDIERNKQERFDKYTQYEFELEKQENQSRDRQAELNNDWLKEDDRLEKEINSKIQKRSEYEKELQNNESKRIHSENLLDIIKKNISSTETIIDRRLVKPHRGFIMYGPPEYIHVGTGKSVIMSKLAKKIGIAMLGPPLAAGELERPLVGQSEAIILDLCMRGNRLPHLMCCVSIDEIDSLAPKRGQNSSEGKVAKISVLLSVIEGIKDVPNLMFFSATNRLHMMDEAFLRRMSGKFFVGRPSAQARKRILEGIPKMILQPLIIDKLATATTNFSGAALKSLASAITVDYIAEKRLKKDYVMTEQKTLILADRTARQYQLYLGIDTLPQLILDNLDAQRHLSETNSSAQFHLSDQYQFTGKIIVSLENKSVRIETIQEINNKRHVIEDDLIETEQNLQQLLERLTSYGNDRNVQLIQLIDLNLLSSQGAFDENRILETLTERYDECMEYKRSMIIYDLDSLIDVSRNESESPSTGTSVSLNQRIYTYVTSRFRESKIALSREKKTMSIERWAIAVVRDTFLLKKFTADVDFMLTERQLKEKEEEYRRATDVLICVKCREHYIESENKMGSCNYHDGFVYDNLTLDLTQYSASDVIEILNREECIDYKETQKKEAIERGKTRFKYICCHATLQVGASFHGCRKDKHGYGKIKINQRTDTAEEELISQWEKLCLSNIKYNHRLKELIDKRKPKQNLE